MKKYKTSFILLLILAVLATVLLLRNTDGTLLKKNNKFAVEDTASITKFFLVDKNNNSVKLVRSANGTWLLNDKHEVNPTMIEIMLKTFRSIEVISPVSKGVRNTMIRVMAGKSVKTEIYQKVYRINIFNKIKLFPHEKLTRVYYIGEVTMDNSGTYMLMEGSEEPFIVGIPGFRGFVASRYSPYEGDWRSHGVFKFRVPDINNVSVIFNDNPERSYRIENNGNKTFNLISLSDNKKIEIFDTAQVVEVLSYYKNLNYERMLDQMTMTRKDSITAVMPAYEIKLVDKLGNNHVLKAWRRKADVGQFDMNGDQAEFDLERMYALVDNEKYLVSIQYFVFNDVLRPLQAFTPRYTGRPAQTRQ